MNNIRTFKALAAATLTAASLVLNARADITNGLVGYWTFDDGSGSSTAADSSGNANAGALTGFSDSTYTSMWTSGRIGGALLFNTNGDTSDYVSIPDQSWLDFTNGLQFTVSAWVNSSVAGASQTTGAAIVAHGYGAGGEQYALGFTNAGKFQFYVRNATGTAVLATSSTVPGAGVWYHLTGVFSGQSTNKQQILYINGLSNVSASASSLATSLKYASNVVSVGNRLASSNISSYTLGFKGLIDDVHIYNRALSSSDVYQLYASNGKAPIISTQPRSVSAYLGDTPTFTVAVDTADSIVPVGYQWRLNGANIAGATSTVWTVTNAQATNAGIYTVVITNYVGTNVSSNAVLTLQSLPAPDTTSGLVGYWKFDDGNGYYAADSSGHGNTGALAGFVSAIWTNGLAGGALAFNGDATALDVVAVPNVGGAAPAILDFSSDPVFTLAAWVEGPPTQTNGGAIIAKGTGGGGEQYVVDLNANFYRFYVRDTNQIVYTAQTAVAPNNTWQHVVAVLNASNGIMNCYINGVLAGEGVAPTSLQTNAHELSIGNRQAGSGNYGDAFTGNIDEVHIFSRDLTSADVQALYHVYDPEIVADPSPTTVNYRAAATFNATVITVKSPVTYAWYVGSTMLVNGLQADGSTVSGAQGTNAGSPFTVTLTLSNVSYLDNNNYTLFLTNSANNSVSSFPAALVVNDPYIVTQPAFSVVLPLGTSASIPLVAAGTGLTSGLTYQWYNTSVGPLSNGGDISGVTTPTLTITNAQYADESSYYAIVTGAGGSVQSSNAAVYVESADLGPFSPTNWPDSIAADGIVDYVIFDPNNSFVSPPGWNNVMSLSTGSAAGVTPVTFDGLLGEEGTSTYLNFIDPNWRNLESYPVIDILLQVYGNSAIYNANGTGLSLTFQEGQLNYMANVKSVIPQGANNGQWNWMLFEITNSIDPATGFRYEGDTSYPIQSGGAEGGVNSGTIRLFGGSGSVVGITIRAVAFGPKGVFGTTNQINRFATTTNCPALPATNLVYIDFNKGVSNNLNVLTNDNLGDSLGYTVQSGVGPANDLRTAIQSTSSLMNFAITSNYLGQPCNGQFTMQLCLEFYDDPNQSGTILAPYQFATDAQGDLAYYGGSPVVGGTSASYYKTTGTGQWLKVAFYVGPVCLEGVGTAPLTGGPTLYIEGAAPLIDRVELGVIQTGTSPLAGLTPDPNYYMNPLICETNYGYYAEWNPNAGVTNNLNISAGYTSAIAGPPNDQRLCEKATASSGAYFFGFSLQNNVFGPALQDNAHLSMLITYYDDPALAGDYLEINTYSAWVNGISTSLTADIPVFLQGTGQWTDAYFELPSVNFSGAFAVSRFAANGPMYISRIRYDVIRPCGPSEGINYLQTLGITNSSTNVSVNWFGSATLESSPNLSGLFTNVVTVTNILTNGYSQSAGNAGFFRLQYPGYPSYLSTNTP